MNLEDFDVFGGVAVEPLGEFDPETGVDDPHVAQLIPLTCIRPGAYQPRGDITPESIEQLAKSIRSQGLIQPITLTRLPSPDDAPEYAIITGERRFRAAEYLSWYAIRAYVRDLTPQSQAAWALIENIQREDLTPVEDARAIQRLQEEFGLSQQALSDTLGRPRPTIANQLRLLTLDPAVLTLLDTKRINSGHAKAALSLPTESQAAFAQQVVEQELSVRRAEALAKRWKNPTPAKKPAEAGLDLSFLNNRLSLPSGINGAIAVSPSGNLSLRLSASQSETLVEFMETHGLLSAPEKMD